MKRKIALLWLILAVSFYAQGMEQIGWVAKFGVAAGPLSVYVKPDLSPINPYVNNFGLDNIAENGMFTWGGGGYAYIMIVPNLRIGGMGFGGSSTNSKTLGGVTKESVYSYGAGAFTVEYTLPFVKNMALSVGAIIGGGYAELQLYERGENVNWSDVWKSFDDSNTNFKSHKLSNKFFTLSPTINLDVPLTRFIAFRLGGGYIISFSNEWTADNGVSLSGVPGSLTSSSFFIQTGLYFGFFAF